MTIAFRPTIAENALASRHPALLALGLRDGSLTALTGQAPTYGRASDGTEIDGLGRLVTFPHSIPRVGAVLNSATGRYEPVVRLEDGQTNLVLQSENFGTTWAAIGTPTRVAAAKTLGDLVMDLIGDDNGAGLEGYSQVVSFTGNAVKACQVVLAPGTSTSVVLRLRDTTAAANRLLVAITWAAGVPTVTMTTGSAIGSPVALADGAYRFEFQTTSVTATNVNQIEVYPATTAALATANTGTVYAGGVMAVNAVIPGEYIKTTTATVARSADALSYPALWPLQANQTWYVRLARPRWADLAGTLTDAYVVSRGATGARLALRFLAASRTLQAEVYDGTTQQQATVAVPAGTGGFLEVAVQFADLLTAPRCRLDVGAGFGSYSSTVTAFASLTATTVVGDAAWSAGNKLFGGLSAFVDVAGLRTLAELQAIAYA